MKTKQHFLFFFLLSGLLISCVDDVVEFKEYNYLPEDYAVLTQTLDLPEEPFNYELLLPDHIGQNVFPRPISNNKATLGRVLFYDKDLSRNGTVSCASCHKQEIAFSDNVAFSQGFQGEETHRNSIALGSVLGFAATYGSSNTVGPNGEFGAAFFWDERAFSASEQALLSLTDNVEMGMTPESIVATVKSKEYYRILFKTAFRGEEINEENILAALESFIDAIGSFNSKLDQAMINGNGLLDFGNRLPDFTNEENNGKELFMANCMACHGTQFTGSPARIANNGLDLVYEDKGVGAVQSLSNMNGVFKVPALRNIALTAPYMHDGRFSSLEEVIDFYSTGIKSHENLDERLSTVDGQAVKFNFTDKEKNELIAFLNTLTDQNFSSEEKYSDPFMR
ncbi:MAG: cytochrome c peroxidase [Bacteroidota bacterium]